MVKKVLTAAPDITTDDVLRFLRLIFAFVVGAIMLLIGFYLVKEHDDAQEAKKEQQADEKERVARRANICEAISAVASANEEFLAFVFGPDEEDTPEEAAAREEAVAKGRIVYHTFIDPALKNCGSAK